MSREFQTFIMIMMRRLLIKDSSLFSLTITNCYNLYGYSVLFLELKPIKYEFKYFLWSERLLQTFNSQ